MGAKSKWELAPWVLTLAIALVGRSGVGSLMGDVGAMHLTERYRILIYEWRRKLHVLEAFNGHYFCRRPNQKSQTSSANRDLAVLPGTGGSAANDAWMRRVG